MGLLLKKIHYGRSLVQFPNLSLYQHLVDHLRKPNYCLHHVSSSLTSPLHNRKHLINVMEKISKTYSTQNLEER